jgi:hypothetical protein
MNDVTQPERGRGTMPSVVAMIAALVGLLAFAPFASAASDPLASGTTTLTLNSGMFKKLRKAGVKVQGVNPATVKVKVVSLPVIGGSVDPTTGQGTFEHSGGIKFKHGKKKAIVNTLVLETTTSSLKAKVAGKSMKLATVKGTTVARNGFGANVSVNGLKLTGNAAKQLNKKLGFTGKKNGKKVKPLFKSNQNLGGTLSETQPKTVAVKPEGNATLAIAASALAKLANVGPEVAGKHPFEVHLAPVDPTKIVSLTPVTVAFPISGGTIGPTATTGVLQTLGGLRLTQNLEAAGPNGKGETTLTLGNVWVDLAAKTASVEVTIENPKTPELNLGKIARSSIADINLTGATITSDPSTLKVSVQNASATLQEVTATTLNQVFVEPIEGKGKGTFAGGDPLGTFSFTAQGE